jgi:hypothetical protein
VGAEGGSGTTGSTPFPRDEVARDSGLPRSKQLQRTLVGSFRLKSMFNKDKAKAGGDEKAAAEAAVRAEVERLEALPLSQLAAEVMVKGFGPDGYLADFARREPYTGGGYVTIHDFAGWLAPKSTGDLRDRLERVSGEGLQVLEHQHLIRATVFSEGWNRFGYVLTRRGRTALENGDVDQMLLRETESR